MSDQNKLIEVQRWIDEVRRTGGKDGLAHALETRLANESDEAVRRTLNFALAGEYRSRERFSDSERIYLAMFSQSPDEPMPLISLAEQKLYYEEATDVAMQTIDRAIEAAFRSGNFRKQALGVKARIASKMRTYSVVEEVLRQLLQLKDDSGGADVGIERDFFDRLPPEAIDKDLARQFDRYCRDTDKPG